MCPRCDFRRGELAHVTHGTVLFAAGFEGHIKGNGEACPQGTLLQFNFVGVLLLQKYLGLIYFIKILFFFTLSANKFMITFKF